MLTVEMEQSVAVKINKTNAFEGHFILSDRVGSGTIRTVSGNRKS